jgi:hypothetical protein
MYDQPGSHVPRNRTAVVERQAVIRQVFATLESVAATAHKLKISRNTVKYAIDPDFAQRRRATNLQRYHVNASIPR